MSKICPLIMLVASKFIDFRVFSSPRNQSGHTFSADADCYEEHCQMWNSETNDCGLKQSTPDITMSDVYLAIQNIPEQLENILDKRDENVQDANRIFDDIPSEPK